MSYEVVPGVSIGAFRLGMTRAEVDALETGPHRVLRETATYFPLEGSTEARLDDALGTGVTVFFDKSGAVSSLEARLSLTPKDPPLFTLAGQTLNGAPVSAIRQDLPGVRFSRWEQGDDFYFSVVVFAPSEPQNAFPYV